jgi:hypothetical protein
VSADLRDGTSGGGRGGFRPRRGRPGVLRVPWAFFFGPRQGKAMKLVCGAAREGARGTSARGGLRPREKGEER